MKKILLITSMLFLTACGDAMTYPVELNKETSAVAGTTVTPVDESQIYIGANAGGRSFTTVGPIKATVGKITAFHPTPTTDQVNQKLRIEAAELGADAVINAEIGDVQLCALSWGCRKATGTAVKFTN